jgi:thiamine-phosphate pyrophosphorylase
MDRVRRQAKFLEVDIYPVTCERLSAGRSNLEVLEAVIAGGGGIIQLREKEYSGKDFYRLALKFREITNRAGILLMINDHLDIAMAVAADGVHLGQDDLPIAVARRLAPELLIGASTHSLEEALQARDDGADYVNIGPIFPTKTKTGVRDFLGPDVISGIGSKIRMPYTVMGGINASNIDQVLSHGARHIAVVTAITQAPDISDAVRSLAQRIRNYRHAGNP